MVLAGAAGPAGTAIADDTVETSLSSDPDPSEVCGDLRVDLLVVIDDSGSMAWGHWSDKLHPDVRDQAHWLVQHLRDVVPDLRVGLAVFSDHPGVYEYPDYKAQYGEEGVDRSWKLVHPFTGDPGGIDDLLDTISGLTHTNGEDDPEAVSRALHEATEMDWRDGANRVVGLFGDAHPHDEDLWDDSYGLDPGPDGEAGTSDDLDYEDVVQRAQVDGVGLSVLAFQHVSGSYEDNEPHKDRTEDAFRRAAKETDGLYGTVQEVQDLEEEIEEVVTRIPVLNITVPEEDRVYKNGTDAGEAPRSVPAVLDGLRFEAMFHGSATDAFFGVEGDLDSEGYEWTDPDPILRATENGTHAISELFPASREPPGLYRLDVLVQDDVDRVVCQTQFFEIPPIGRAAGARDQQAAGVSLADTGSVIRDTVVTHLGGQVAGYAAYDIRSSVDVIGPPGAVNVSATTEIGYLTVPTGSGELLEFRGLWIHGKAACGEEDGISEMEAVRILLHEGRGPGEEIPPGVVRSTGLLPGDQIEIHDQDTGRERVEASMVHLDPFEPSEVALDIGFVEVQASCGGLPTSELPWFG